MRCARITLGLSLVGLIVGSLACDRPPAVPKTAEGRPVSALATFDPQETALAQHVVDARDMYHFRLLVLRGYYHKIGDLLKHKWAENEIENLTKAHTFTFDALTPAPVPPSPNLDHTDELSLAEPAVAARRQYIAAVTALRDYYNQSNQEFKLAMTQNVLDRFDPIRTYMYFLQAEVPPLTMRPLEVHPEAERLFEQALKLHRDGKILPLVVDYGKQREALMTFLELIRKYPNSTRIGHSAYYIADIYKEYFNENYRAALWYERAWQWEPTITKPARFQAAVVYDIRLHHRGKALELYREVIKHETFSSSNVGFARRRISELTQEGIQP